MAAAIGNVAAGLASQFGGMALQNYFNVGAAQHAQNFAEQMYQHRYRYTMKDMRKAGLNPVLAGEVGGGSTPTVAAAMPPDVSGAADAVGNVFQRYQQFKAQQANTKIQENQAVASDALGPTAKANLDAAEWNAVKAHADAVVATADEQVANQTVDARVNSAKAALENTRANTALSAANARSAAVDADASETPAGRAAAVANKILAPVATGAKTVGEIMPSSQIEKTFNKTVNFNKR